MLNNQSVFSIAVFKDWNTATWTDNGWLENKLLADYQ